MARSDIELHKAETIGDEVDQLQTEIRQRAYDLFHDRGDVPGRSLSDWLDAERELVWKPAVELRRKDTEIEVLAATPGVDPKELEVRITPDDILIKANVDHRHTTDKGDVQVCEFTEGHLFRSIHFPDKVNPDSATAEYRNGLLRITAPLAKPVIDENIRG